MMLANACETADPTEAQAVYRVPTDGDATASVEQASLKVLQRHGLVKLCDATADMTAWCLTARSMDHIASGTKFGECQATFRVPEDSIQALASDKSTSTYLLIEKIISEGWSFKSLQLLGIMRRNTMHVNPTCQTPHRFAR